MSNKYDWISGVKFVEEREMKLSDIFVDNGKNKQRNSDKGECDGHRNALVLSFKEHGILEERPNIVVEDRDGKTWLADGFNRFYAMDTVWGLDLAVKVDVIMCADDCAREDLQISANIALPQSEATQKSIINTLTEQVKRGDLKKTQAAVKFKVNQLCKGKNKAWKDQIISAVMNDAGVPTDWRNWSDGLAKNWLANHHGRTTGFEYDPVRECYGAVMKQESEYRTLMRAFEKFAQTGIHTEVVICALEKGNASLDEKRQDIIDTTNRWIDALMNVCGVNEFPNGCPLIFVGALPQDFKVEHGECMIPIDPDTDVIGTQPKRTLVAA